MPCTVGLLNIKFLLRSFTAIDSIKSLPTFVATVFETYRYLIFLMLSIAKTKIGINEVKSPGRAGKSIAPVIFSTYVYLHYLPNHQEKLH